MSTVHVVLSKTIQDNYEPLRIEIGITDETRPGEKVSDAVNRVYTFVEKTLLEKVGAELKELGRTK